MSSVATWWCGQSKALQYVLDHIDSLVIKGAFAWRSRPPAFGDAMSRDEKQTLIEQIRSAPHEYVGQEMLSLSTVPTLTKSGLEPRPMVLRTYIAASGDSYIVFPGGLTRISGAIEKPIVSMQSGGGSKDTWVLSEKPVLPTSLPSQLAGLFGLENPLPKFPAAWLIISFGWDGMPNGWRQRCGQFARLWKGGRMNPPRTPW